MDAEIIKRNFNPNKHYTYLIGVGYYINDLGELKKYRRTIQRSLNILAKETREYYDSNNLFVLIDDDGDFPIDLDGIEELEGLPTIQITLDRNIGAGGKENILEYLATLSSELYFRFDSDVLLTTPILRPIHNFLKENDRISFVTINAGFMGSIYEKERKETGKSFIETAQIGNAVGCWTELFNDIGYSDSLLYYFHDLDMVYKAKRLGLKSGMLMTTKGRTKSSRRTALINMKIGEAQYLHKVAPYLKISYLKKDNMPIIRYNPNKPSLFENRYNPPSPLAIALGNSIFKFKGKIIYD